MPQGPGSTRQNNGPFVVGGFYNASPFSLIDGQACALQLDVNGNLKVAFSGTISGGNPAAGPTGAPVPADADYLGVNVGGTLDGVTGFAVGPSVGIAVAIIDGSGNQITSFGGGTQYADDAASGATPTGTLAMGWDSVNSVVRALKVDTNQNLETSAPSIVDPNNSTTALLGANGVFTGTATDLLIYKAITVAVFADQVSTQMQVEWSQNGTNWDFVESFPIGAGVAAAVTNIFTIKARFFRVVYTNGSTPQGAFRLQVLLHPVAINFRSVMLASQPSVNDEALLVNAVLTAQNLNNTAFQKLKAASGGLVISGTDGSGLGNLLPVAGNGTLASGNVVTVGGLDNSGNAIPFSINSGVLAITAQTTGSDGQNNNALGVFVAGGGQLVTIGSYPSVFNGTTWDRLRSGGATGILGIAGAAASGASKAGNPVQIGGVFNTTQPTVTTGQAVEAQATARGALIVATGVDAFNVAFASAQHVIVDSGSITVSGAISFTAPQHVIVDSGSITVSGAISFTAPQHVIVDSGSITVSGAISFTAPQHVIVDSGSITITFSAPQHVIVDSGTIAGNLTNNNAAPGATNIGVLPAVANTQPPSLLNGDQVLVSTDLAGNLRVANQSVQSVVQKTSNSSSGSVASLAKAFVSNNIAGNSIVVVCGVGNGTAPTVTDSKGNSYFQVTSITGGSGAFGTYIFLATNIAVGANTVTVNNGGAAASIAMEIYEVQGILTPSFSPRQSVDFVAASQGTSTTASTSLINLVGGNEIAFSAVGVGTAAQTITPGSGWLNDSGQLNPTTPAGLFSFVSMSTWVFGPENNQAGSSISPTASLAGSEPWSICAATFYSYQQPISGSVVARITGTVQVIPQPAVGSALTPIAISSTAATVLKASLGNLYGAWLVNLATSTATTANLTMYVHFFNTNTTTGLTTGSWLFALPIASSGVVNTIGAGAGAGLNLPPGAFSLASFLSGIVIVINTTSTSNTTAAGTAPVGVIWIE